WADHSQDRWRSSGCTEAIVHGIKVCLLAALLGFGAPLSAKTSSVEQYSVEGVSLRIEFGDATFRGGTQPLREWIERSLRIVSAYYDGFPATSLRIQVVPESGGGVQGGKTWGYRGGFIRVQVGRDVTEAQLKDDWVLVHEMTHLALPDVGDDQTWFSEG